MTGALRGVAAAFITPLLLATDRWRRLLEPPAVASGTGPVHAATAGLRAGGRTLRLLAKLPASPWRTTCLYSSVTACLTLRWAGVPALLRLGAGGPQPDTADARAQAGALPAIAHAWVEDPAGTVLHGRSAGWVAFEPARRPEQVRRA